MSPVISSQSMVLATAMAVSGATVILLAINRLQKSTPSSTPHYPLQSCIVSSDDGKKKEQRKKKKVHFAEDVVDPIGNGDEYRKKLMHTYNNNINSCNNSINSNSNSSINYSKSSTLKKGGKVGEMPANRVALYNGILKDRVHRVAYSH